MLFLISWPSLYLIFWNNSSWFWLVLAFKNSYKILGCVLYKLKYLWLEKREKQIKLILFTIVFGLIGICLGICIEELEVTRLVLLFVKGILKIKPTVLNKLILNDHKSCSWRLKKRHYSLIVCKFLNKVGKSAYSQYRLSVTFAFFSLLDYCNSF